MASSTIRVSDLTHDVLKNLSRQTGEPIGDLVAKAAEMLRREYFLRATNEAFAALRSNPDEWQAELDERSVWDATLLDGQVEP
jgi:hypothetical protein